MGKEKETKLYPKETGLKGRCERKQMETRVSE